MIADAERAAAILKGCEFAPTQSFEGSAFANPRSRAACVYGAMALGLLGGWAKDWFADTRASQIMQADQKAHRYRNRRCPECRGSVPELTHFNDIHRWTREQIAAWLAK